MNRAHDLLASKSMAMADVIFEIGGKALMRPSDGDSDTPVISTELEINRNDLDPVRTQNIIDKK